MMCIASHQIATIRLIPLYSLPSATIIPVMAYVLDIQHPRIQNAMATLGIEDHELLIK